MSAAAPGERAEEEAVVAGVEAEAALVPPAPPLSRSHGEADGEDAEDDESLPGLVTDSDQDSEEDIEMLPDAEEARQESARGRAPVRHVHDAPRSRTPHNPPHDMSDDDSLPGLISDSGSDSDFDNDDAHDQVPRTRPDVGAPNVAQSPAPPRLLHEIEQRPAPLPAGAAAAGRTQRVPRINERMRPSRAPLRHGPISPAEAITAARRELGHEGGLRDTVPPPMLVSAFVQQLIGRSVRDGLDAGPAEMGIDDLLGPMLAGIEDAPVLRGPGGNAFGLDLLDAQLGPPPASEEAIGALDLIAPTEGATCAICLDEYTAEDRVRNMPCEHSYHEKCLNDWLRRHGTCPQCRFELMDANAPPAPRPPSSSQPPLVAPFSQNLTELETWLHLERLRSVARATVDDAHRANQTQRAPALRAMEPRPQQPPTIDRGAARQDSTHSDHDSIPGLVSPEGDSGLDSDGETLPGLVPVSDLSDDASSEEDEILSEPQEPQAPGPAVQPAADMVEQQA